MDSTDILVPGKRRKVKVSSAQFHQRNSGRLLGSAHLQALGSESQMITTSVTISPNGNIRFLSDRVYTVGRKKSSCDIVLNGNITIVSRVHCQFLLHGHSCKLLLTDGLFQDGVSTASKRNVGTSNKYSMNGVFVNGQRISRGTVHELFVGDEVCLGCFCRKSSHNNTLDSGFGFIVKSIVFFNTHNVIDETVQLSKNDPSARVILLLSMCRRILQSKDPISCICESLDMFGIKKPTLVYDGEKINDNPRLSCNDLELEPEKDADCVCPSDGRTLYLNRLEFMDPKGSDNCKTISLPELFYPVGSLIRVFIATFTCDVSWFLSCCKIPKHLPVTIACHDSVRCWSSETDSRTSSPCSDYSNLILVYPQFPEEIAFGKDHKKRGVGCHHPKLIVLQRKDSIRIIVTSANLVSRQWNTITNTVWFQDFPYMNNPNYSAFFTSLSTSEIIEESCTDFVAQLAGFMASLIVDAPSEAYWITELANYDFRGAAAYLVASVPGIHADVSPSFSPDYKLSERMEIMYSKSSNFKLLGYVKASVVGLSHRFYSKNDSTGTELKTLALFLKNCKKDAFGLSEVVLRRTSNIAADVNAVSVLVSDLNEFSKGAYIQLGFVPKDIAKWISPLSDVGYFSFSAFIFPKEALTAALGSCNSKVQLILHVSQGPNFFNISRSIQPEYFVPLCSLLATVQRHMGIWRLQELLCRYRWPESLETDFVYGCSSIGTSVCPQYLASFSAASGKKSLLFTDSEESDPEWGRWNTTHELKSPSLSILFPTIERSRNAIHGIQSSRCLLAFSEKTWLKLRNSGTLHDEVPHPNVRLGYPMHVKVACRRFQAKEDNALSFGWIYCGSHNFSPSAWGHQMQCPTSLSENSASSPRLHICNYELGIVFVFPPPSNNVVKDVIGGAKRPNLDDINLPFVMPAPKYSYNDRPTTAQAIREVVAFEKETHLVDNISVTEEDAIDEEIADDEDVFEYVNATEEKEDEKIYAEMLWSQVSSSGTP